MTFESRKMKPATADPRWDRARRYLNEQEVEPEYVAHKLGLCTLIRPCCQSLNASAHYPPYVRAEESLKDRRPLQASVTGDAVIAAVVKRTAPETFHHGRLASFDP